MAVRTFTAVEQRLATALRPFAAFYVAGAPDHLVITRGSQMAKRQLTMGNCRVASETLEREGLS